MYLTEVILTSICLKGAYKLLYSKHRQPMLMTSSIPQRLDKLKVNDFDERWIYSIENIR